jgi:hypothetical protein
VALLSTVNEMWPRAQGHAEVFLTAAGQYTADLELERHCW